MKTLIKKSKYKIVRHIRNYQLMPLYISHEETYIPTDADSDFAEEETCFVGWIEPVKSMSLKGAKTKMIVPKHICLVEDF